MQNSELKDKMKEAYNEEQYEIIRSETEKMLIERFDFPPNHAKVRADLEVSSLKETFRKMPEFI